MFFYLNRKFLKIFTLLLFFFNLGLGQKIVLSSTIEYKKDLLIEQNITVGTYILGPGDSLNFILYDEPNFSGEYQIINDGTITFPIIGNVSVENLSINQATNKIKNLYSKELLRPDLFLGIAKTRPLKISIVGEVKRPGIYSLGSDDKPRKDNLNSNSNYGLPTVIEALQKAGGITQKANLKEIILLRRLPGKNIAYKKTTLNLAELINDGNQIYNPFLFDGDIIKIKTVENPGSSFASISRNNLTSKNIEVYVVGEVLNPGKITIANGTPMAQAIYQSGGPIPLKGNLANVELVRINKNGSIKKKRYRIDLQKSISEENPILEDKDIIRVIPTKLETASKGLKIIGEPLRDVISVYSIFKIID